MLLLYIVCVSIYEIVRQESYVIETGLRHPFISYGEDTPLFLMEIDETEKRQSQDRCETELRLE